MTETRLTPWHCATCGKHHPIRPLARDCEKRHRQEARNAAPR